MITACKPRVQDAHTYSCRGYATLLKDSVRIMHDGFLCLTKPAFLRRPWRITPCPAVHGWAFLAFRHNPTDSKHLRYAPLQEYVCASCTRGLRALRCSFNDKWLILCFLTIFSTTITKSLYLTASFESGLMSKNMINILSLPLHMSLNNLISNIEWLHPLS